MFIVSHLTFISLSILCVYSWPSQRPAYDINCPAKGGILCMLDELKILQTVAGSITYKLAEIEKHIQQKTTAVKILNKNVQVDINHTRMYLPTSYYHKEFFLRSNIDKKFLTELILEGHNAMVFFHNTIDDLLNLKGIFSRQTDEWFGKIRKNIEDDIICRYRSVLDIFSQKWIPRSQIGRMYFSKKSNLSPSTIHDVHALVIAKYLKEWSEQIDQVMKNLPQKYF